MSASTKAAIHIRTRVHWDIGRLQEHEFRRASELIRHHPEVGTQARWDSECEIDWMYISFMDETLAGSWSGNQVVKGKSTSLFRFSFILQKKSRILQMQIEDGKVKWKNFSKTHSYRGILDLRRTAWVRVEHSPTTHVIHKDLQEQNIEPEDFENRIIFMSMFNDIDWTRRGSSQQCISNSEQVKNYAKKFTQGHWTFRGPGGEKKR